MDMTDTLPEQVLTILAIDLGLFILVGWFLLLLLMLREFRKFAKQSQQGNFADNPMLPLCQESVDSALRYVNDNVETIDRLVEVQQALENQLREIRESTRDHITSQEQESITDLNDKLAKSHALIRKLKGDLELSQQRLKTTREKLFAQYDTVETLQKEKAKLEERYQNLEKEYMATSASSGKVHELERNYQVEKQNLVAMLNQYKRQVGEQEQAINQLMKQAETADGNELNALKQQLKQAQQSVHHMGKEKDFIESKYMELLKEVENKR